MLTKSTHHPTNKKPHECGAWCDSIIWLIIRFNNTKITFSEIVQIATKAGANPITISGLSGLGDTLASSYSPLSRNRSAGELIGKKDSIESLKTKIDNVIEGIDTLYGAKQLSNKISHDAQFVDLMIRVCTQQTDPMSLIKNTIGKIE